jgi:hypothetical protein
VEQITEARIAEIFGLDLSDPETKALWDAIGDINRCHKSIEEADRAQLTERWKQIEHVFNHTEMIPGMYFQYVPVEQSGIKENTLMDKIPTLFLRDPHNWKLITHEVNPEAAWVLEGYGVPTVKKDGINVRVTILNGKCIALEKRRNPTREEKALGAEPGYVLASIDDPADKHIFAAVDNTNYIGWPDGQYPCEALGPKIQGGIESPYPVLYPFSLAPIPLPSWENPRTWQELLNYLGTHEIEGIVWHDAEYHRFAKIKRRDYNLPWPIKRNQV